MRNARLEVNSCDDWELVLAVNWGGLKNDLPEHVDSQAASGRIGFFPMSRGTWRQANAALARIKQDARDEGYQTEFWVARWLHGLPVIDPPPPYLPTIHL